MDFVTTQIIFWNAIMMVVIAVAPMLIHSSALTVYAFQQTKLQILQVVIILVHLWNLIDLELN